MPMRMYTATLGAALTIIAAQEGAAEPNARGSLFSPSQIQIDAQPDANTSTSSEPDQYAYGSRGDEHITVLSIFAPNLSGEFDTGLTVQYTNFIIDDFEVGVEGTLWGFFQDDSTAGLSTSLVMRYHFFQAQRWSAFAEAGMGVLLAGDDVPDEGTSFNFMPRFGGGVTWRIFEDSPTRLMAGLRWHHISNARIKGETDNPARDAPGLFVGLVYEF